MPRRMTLDEATDLLEVAFNVSPETIESSLIEVFVADVDMDLARSDIESFLAVKPGNIDPESIELHPDFWDEADLSGVRIVIKLEG